MRANYSTRRSSVVFNPRGGVFGGLRGGYDGEGTGVDPGPGGGYDYGGSSYGGTVSEQAAKAAADNAAAAAFVAAQKADEAALKAASDSLKQTQAETKVAATIASKVALVGLSVVGGPIGSVVGYALQASGLVDKAIQAAVDGLQLSYETNIQSAEQALSNARNAAGGDTTFTSELNTIQANLDTAKKAGIQAAVTTLYRTYAKRDPDPGGLAYWSNAFGPTITADEVLAFQQVLYANEPNLRPVATATQTTQTSTNLALPIIAAVAGFLLFGS